MRALMFDPSDGLALSDVPTPSPLDECLIRVTKAGICGTDLQILNGYAGFAGILGHEFTGVVERAPAGEAHWIGQRVVGEINVGCNVCERCVAGVKEHCLQRTVTGIRGRSGAFAEYLSLPAANLHRVPDEMDDATAVFVEPVAAACRILEQIAIESTAHVAIVGDGRLGILCAQVVRTRTPDVTLFGRYSRKRQVAQTLGLEATSDTANQAGRFDIVVDATGSPQGFADAAALVKPRGVVILKSTCHGEARSPFTKLVVDEITVVGSRCGPFAKAIPLLASGAVQTAPLVSHTFPLARFHEAFAAAGRHLKVLFDCCRET
jgi:alcohol dehydrogenase